MLTFELLFRFFFLKIESFFLIFLNKRFSLKVTGFCCERNSKRFPLESNDQMQRFGTNDELSYDTIEFVLKN